MFTSTSVNAKLYGYLSGYETTCFTGKDCNYVISAIRELIVDEFRINFPEQEIQESNISNILSNVDKFFIRYYDRMKRVSSADKVKTLADNSKNDKNDLDVMLSKLMSNECTLTVAAFMALGQNANPLDICEKCPWYLQHKFCMIYVMEESEDAIIQQFNFKVAEYKYLALALMQTANYLVSQLGVSVSDLNQYYTIFTDILTCSHIFELMNPSGSAREEYLTETLNLLKSPHITYTSETYQKYDDLLTSVFKDVIQGKLPYIKDMHDAIFGTKHFLDSKFDPNRDYYYSMKGTGQSGFTGERHSLVSSAFEVDTHAEDPRVKAFDSSIGYESKYRKLKEGENPPDTSIRTIGINNPGKFKPRIIHIVDNPLQDRCNWIHRRLMALIQRLNSDSTKNHDKGRKFLQNLTRKWFLSSKEDKIGIYCTDFKNATDTSDQRFSHRVVGFIFHNETIAEFWDYVSEIDKEFCHADGTKEVFSQLTGQPQGALASFLIFALCHHFIFLMDMKEFGLTHIKPEDFYTVLGDDAVYNTVTAESRYVDEDEILYDECGIQRSELEIAHFDKCTAYAGLIINYDKSESAHQWSEEAKLDFAKVTYRNGKLFSPVPFRLAMRYNASFDDMLAVSIWRADRDDPLANKLVDLQISKLPESKREEYTELIRCGELPFLDRFYDRKDRSYQYLNRVRYALFISMLSAGLSFTLMNDDHRVSSSFDQYDRAMATVFSTKHLLKLDQIDPNHKVMLLIEQNAEIIQALHDIYRETDFDDVFLSMCLASFMGDQKEDILWMIYDIVNFQHTLGLAAANPNISRKDLEDLFPEMRPYRDIKKDVNIISNKFITRGLTKKPTEFSYLFRKTFVILESLHQQLDESFSELRSE